MFSGNDKYYYKEIQNNNNFSRNYNFQQINYNLRFNNLNFTHSNLRPYNCTSTNYNNI